ncbi:MAG: DMT family transporter [Pseudomonadota bacterium]
MTTTTEQAARGGFPVLGLLILAALSFVWGVNWPVMKIAVSEMTVWWFRSICLIFGGLGLLFIAAITRSAIIPKHTDVGPMLLTACFAVGGWHVCAGFGVALMPAGRAVIIAFTMPIWTALAAIWILGERLKPTTIAGLALGLVGITVLIGPDIAIVGQAPLGAMFMLAAAISWGLGTVLFKRFNWSIPVVSNMGWQLLAASVPVTTIAALDGPMPDWFALSTPVMIAMAYVLLLPMTFGQWAYFQIIRWFPASIAAIGTLAIPIVGVYSSAILLNEPVGVRELTSLGLICLALIVVLILPYWINRRGQA